MSIHGELLIPGRRKTRIVGYAAHTATSTSYTRVGSSSSVKASSAVDDRYFDLDNGVFTCKKTGTYSISFYARNSNNSSGTVIYIHYQIVKVSSGTSTSIVSVTSNTYSINGHSETVNVSLNEGDTLYAQTKNNTGGNTHNFGYFIQTT